MIIYMYFEIESNIYFDLGEVEFKNPNEKLENRLRLLCCVTVYNESQEELFMTLKGIFENMDSFLDQGISTYDIAVCVVFDGILKLNPSMQNYFKSLDSEMDSHGTSIESKMEEINRGAEVYLKEAGENKIKFITRKKEIDNKNYLPPEIPKKTSVCYQVQLTNDDFDCQLRHKIKLNVFFNVKITNKGKLSSHLWFFQGFCKFLQPQYCALIDCGTKPDKKGLFNFFRVLEADEKVGGLCGYMGVRYERKPAAPVSNEKRTPKQKIIDFLRAIKNVNLESVLDKIETIFDIQKAQEFEYCFAHIFDKAFESTFGFIAVLPGAWSAYRWDALSEDNLLEREYLQTVLDPNFLPQSLKQANKLLAEDRLLCLAIFTKRNKDYVLKYVPDAEANTDLLNTIPDLILQRKRWINGTWYALDYVLQYQNQIRFSAHSEWRKMFFHLLLGYSKLGMISTYFLMSAFLITYRILMFEFFGSKRFIEDDSASLAGFFFYIFIALLELVIFLCLMFKPNDKAVTILFRLLAHLLGALSLFSFILLLVLLGTEVFGNPTGYFGDQNLMRALSIANVICYLLIALMNPERIWTLIKCSADYIYYTPTYLHIMIIYAFCRIDDLSWGTKGADSSEHSGNEQKFYLEKVEFVGAWIFSNAIVTYVVTVLISSQQNKYYFMTALITFTTGLLMIKTFFAIIYQFVFVNWIDKSSIASAFERKKQFYKEQTTQIEKYINNIIDQAAIPNFQVKNQIDFGISNGPEYNGNIENDMRASFLRN